MEKQKNSLLEEEAGQLLVTALTGIMLLPVLILLVLLNNKFKSKSKNLFFIIKPNPLFFFLKHKFLNRYGKIFSCSLHGKWAVVSVDPVFNKFVMQNEGKLFQSSYPKSFRDLVGKNGVITAQGEQQRKLHSIASNMMRLDKLKFHFLNDIQRVIQETFNNIQDNQVILLQDVCRKVCQLKPPWSSII